MISTASKYFYGVVGATLAAGVVYGLLYGNDRVGTGLLLAAAVAAAIAGATLNPSPDLAPRFDPDEAPLAQASTVDAARATRPSIAPLLMVLSLGVLAVAAVKGKDWLVIGGVVVTLSGGLWFAQAWREDPAWSIRIGARTAQRITSPWALPVASLGLLLVIAISISRVLLAASEKGSVVVAVVVAATLLAAYFIISARPKIGTKALVGASGVAMVAVVGAGLATGVNGQRTFENKGETDIPTTLVTAADTRFNVSQLEAPADKEFRIQFKNQQAGVFHNISIYTKAIGGDPLYSGTPVVGGKQVLYQIGGAALNRSLPAAKPLAAGKYWFRCDFHATSMVGTLTVKAEA